MAALRSRREAAPNHPRRRPSPRCDDADVNVNVNVNDDDDDDDVKVSGGDDGARPQGRAQRPDIHQVDVDDDYDDDDQRPAGCAPPGGVVDGGPGHRRRCAGGAPRRRQPRRARAGGHDGPVVVAGAAAGPCVVRGRRRRRPRHRRPPWRRAHQSLQQRQDRHGQLRVVGAWTHAPFQDPHRARRRRHGRHPGQLRSVADQCRYRRHRRPSAPAGLAVDSAAAAGHQRVVGQQRAGVVCQLRRRGLGIPRPPRAPQRRQEHRQAHGDAGQQWPRRRRRRRHRCPRHPRPRADRRCWHGVQARLQRRRQRGCP